MFHRAGVMAEKALLLYPTSQNNWADGAHSLPPLPEWVGWANHSVTSVKQSNRKMGTKQGESSKTSLISEEGSD